MATKTYLFKGITKWAKVRKPDEMYDNYQVPLYLTEDSWKDFQESGIQLKIKEDTDGKFVTFKRRHVEFNYAKKAQQVNGPPAVHIFKDGTYQDFPDGLIGNGSEVTLKVDAYDTRNGKGHRLISVGIDKLVEYHESERSTAIPAMPF